MARPILVDLRNIYSDEESRSRGFYYVEDRHLLSQVDFEHAFGQP
jgi:hypothetical protein